METIAVAAIGAIGLVASTWIQSHRNKRVVNTLGEQNGSTVMEKLDCIHAWTLRHEYIHARLEARLDDAEV